MRNSLLYVVIVLLTGSGCKQNDSSLPQDNITRLRKDSASAYIDSFPIKYLTGEKIQIPHLYSFKQSPCTGEFDEDDQGAKVTKYINEDTLVIIINKQSICLQIFEGDFRINQDTIFLVLDRLGTIQKNGKIDSIYLPPNCLCRYNFTFNIIGIAQMPKYYSMILK